MYTPGLRPCNSVSPKTQSVRCHMCDKAHCSFIFSDKKVQAIWTSIIEEADRTLGSTVPSLQARFTCREFPGGAVVRTRGFRCRGSGSVPVWGTKILQAAGHDKKKKTGLPWWRSGKESACQCRGHGFEPWSGKIPHAVEQLSPCTTTTEPVL